MGCEARRTGCEGFWFVRVSAVACGWWDARSAGGRRGWSRRAFGLRGCGFDGNVCGVRCGGCGVAASARCHSIVLSGEASQHSRGGDFVSGVDPIAPLALGSHIPWGTHIILQASARIRFGPQDKTVIQLALGGEPRHQHHRQAQTSARRTVPPPTAWVHAPARGTGGEWWPPRARAPAASASRPSRWVSRHGGRRPRRRPR